jgi:hypothetical protein
MAGATQIAGLVQTLEASVAMLETSDRTAGGPSPQGIRTSRPYPANRKGPSPIRLSESELTALAGMISARLTGPEIAARMGYSPAVIVRNARQFGLYPDGKKPRAMANHAGWQDPKIRARRLVNINQSRCVQWSDARDLSLSITLAAGWSWKRIAAHVGVCERLCKSRVKFLGLLVGRKPQPKWFRG